MKKTDTAFEARLRSSLPETPTLRYGVNSKGVVMRPMCLALAVVCAGLLTLGCGEDTGTPSTDTNTNQDTAQTDVAQADTGGATDTGTTDAGSPDSGAVDTMVADSGAADAATVDVAPADVGMPGDTGGIEPVSFATVFNEVLNPKGCTGGYCHAGHAGGLLMDTMESAYDNLVNKETTTETPCDSTMRVVPGDPDASMLWIRVRPNADDCLTAEQKMPPFGDSGLTDEELKLIHDWILTGANP